MQVYKMIKRNHYSKLTRTPEFQGIICKFSGRRGYHNLSDVIQSPFNGKVTVWDTNINREIGKMGYAELRKKFI